MLFDITSQLLLGADTSMGFLIVARPGLRSIACLSATGESSGTNPARVRLDAAGQYPSEAVPASGSAETFTVYVAVGSVVGQETITQEAP